MNNIIRNIKNKLNEKQINNIKFIVKTKNINKFKEYKNKKKIFYMLTPTHGNLGDQAIAYATNIYLKEQFKEYEVIEIYREDTYKYARAIKKVLNNDDIIILHGGGNMGNLYPIEEVDRRAVIDFFKNYKIVSMTQTMNFSDDKNGKEELNKTKNIYNKHSNLTLIARENKSYESMKRELDIKKIIVNPDIVLYLNNKFVQNKKRDMIMTCLRGDKESLLGQDKVEFIDKLRNTYENLFEYDTVVDKIVKKEFREDELMDMLNKFLTSKVVITDRLHGMVFAAITRTPCIVTKSLDHKVTGTYEWIKELNYIKLIDKLNFDKINEVMKELSNLKEYTKIDLNEKYFFKLKDKIVD